MIAIGKMFELEYIADRLVTHADGAVSVINRDGTVMSVQPDGAVQVRPAGSYGAYERSVIVGNHLVYCPTGERAFAFPFAASLP